MMVRIDDPQIRLEDWLAVAIEPLLADRVGRCRRLLTEAGARPCGRRPDERNELTAHHGHTSNQSTGDDVASRLRQRSSVAVSADPACVSLRPR